MPKSLLSLITAGALAVPAALFAQSGSAPGVLDAAPPPRTAAGTSNEPAPAPDTTSRAPAQPNLGQAPGNSGAPPAPEPLGSSLEATAPAPAADAPVRPAADRAKTAEADKARNARKGTKPE